MLNEKEALEEISKQKFEEMKQKAAEGGRRLEVIPSKVVFTKKPGPGGGKPKVRWVVCGNFEEKKPISLQVQMRLWQHGEVGVVPRLTSRRPFSTQVGMMIKRRLWW